MDFRESMNYIEEKNKLGSVPGLENITELLTILGNPEEQIRCIHIAGTNGKGSVFSFVENILMDAGFSVGRYVSPTISTYLERFTLNRQVIGEEEFACILTDVSIAVEKMIMLGLASPTAFEIETAVAFLYFKNAGVDYALIECGMGGQKDATNVISKPVVSTIASISMDHMQFLGDTLEAIAQQKAGIIRGGHCVTAPQKEETLRVLRKKCEEENTALSCANLGDVSIVEMDISGTEFLYKGEVYKIKLLGEHQIENAITAIEVASLIEGVTDFNIKSGLEKTVWAGRMTVVLDKPLFLVDGAHNEAAWLSLRKSVNKYFTNRRIIYIMGVLRDKEYEKMIDILLDTMYHVVTVTPESPRALPRETLLESLSQRGIRAQSAPSSRRAIELAGDVAFDCLRNEEAEPCIIVCGSLSFLSDYLDSDFVKSIILQRFN